MTNEEIVEQFRLKLFKEKRSLTWFVRNRCNDVSYVYFNMQINGNSNMQDVVKDSITKYLNEEK